MVYLHDIFDLDAFRNQVAEGYIRLQTNSAQNLTIANYTPKAQYDRHWTPETIASRGLIYNPNTLEIVARGFNKFFGWDESGQPYPPSGSFLLSEKYDGSLGILYRKVNGEFAVATRGSFEGDIALHATKRLHEIMEEWDISADQMEYFADLEMTPLFEIIYPGNRVVVDYLGADHLVLIDVISNRSAESFLSAFDEFDWPWKANRKMVRSFDHSIIDEIPAGEEGFVLYWPVYGFRCKMKSSSYVQLHRIVTGMSEKMVWAMLAGGKSVEQIKEPLPDELYAWVDNVVADLYDRCAAVCDRVQEVYNSIPTTKNRAEFARQAMNYPDVRKYLFLMYDGVPRETIWRKAWESVKPVGDTRMFARSEDDN